MRHILILYERARYMILVNLMQKTQVNITFTDLYVYLLLMHVQLKDLYNSEDLPVVHSLKYQHGDRHSVTLLYNWSCLL